MCLKGGVNMNERIKLVRKSAGLTLDKFGKRIGISAPACSNLESGKTNPSSQTILSICREFSVSEKWLLTGEGEMRVPRTQEEEIAEIVGRALRGSNDFKRSVVRMICSRTDDELEVLESALRAILENQ